jgi:hypothetical protein
VVFPPFSSCLKCEVVCDHKDIPVVTINQIKSTNTTTLKARKLRLLCKAVQFDPPLLEDFAAAWCDSCEMRFLTLCWGITSSWRISQRQTCPRCNLPPNRNDSEHPFVWDFKLLLKDTEESTLPAIVANEEGIRLLKMNAAE